MNPTVTNNQGFLNDMDLASYWTGPTDSADPLTGQAFTSDGDVITMTGTANNNSASEYFYYKKTGTSISTTTYPKFTVRWKTSDSVGCGARIDVYFAEGGSQSLLNA